MTQSFAAYLVRRLAAAAAFVLIVSSGAFTLGHFQQLYGESAMPMFLTSATGECQVVTADHRPLPHAGQTLIAVVDATAAEAAKLLTPPSPPSTSLPEENRPSLPDGNLKQPTNDRHPVNEQTGQHL